MTLDELDGQCRLSNAWYECIYDQSYKIIVHYIRAHRHHQRQRVCILVGMQPVQPVKALDFFEYTKQQRVNVSREHGIHEGRRGSRSLQAWTAYSGGSICSHVRVMYNAKERDVREGAEGGQQEEISDQGQILPNLMPSRGILCKQFQESILLRQDKFSMSRYNMFI